MCGLLGKWIEILFPGEFVPHIKISRLMFHLSKYVFTIGGQKNIILSHDL